MVQVRIVLKQWITWESIICCHLQPLNGRLGFVHERISARDGISRMMKVAEVLSQFGGSLDFRFGGGVVTRRGCEQSLDAGQGSTFILRIIFQSFRNSRGRLFLSPQVEQCTGG